MLKEKLVRNSVLNEWWFVKKYNVVFIFKFGWKFGFIGDFGVIIEMKECVVRIWIYLFNKYMLIICFVLGIVRGVEINKWWGV